MDDFHCLPVSIIKVFVFFLGVGDEGGYFY